MTRISVCLATYNGEKYIGEQLQSILIQLSQHDEVIISDDSSSDRTIDIVQAFGDSRIIILHGQTFRSPIRNFENALSHAGGQYIFLADQDDVWLPEKV
ncbi:MAG: glycosyltransferase, partial [Bacteroidia bacterium]